MPREEDVFLSVSMRIYSTRPAVLIWLGQTAGQCYCLECGPVGCDLEVVKGLPIQEVVQLLLGRGEGQLSEKEDLLLQCRAQ